MLLADIKHTLKNVYSDTNEEIHLIRQIRFVFDPKMNTGIKEMDEKCFHHIVSVYKKGRSWKVCDEFNNEYTLSNQTFEFQSLINSNLMSMKDSRVKFKQENYKIELV